MPIQRAQINRADLLARRAQIGEPGDAGCNRSADRRVEPKRSAASLSRVPDSDDLLGLGDRLALSRGAFGPAALAAARSRSCARRLGPMPGKAISSARRFATTLGPRRFCR
jgi:hypothetical protein